MSKKDQVPPYTPSATAGPSRNEILAHYNLTPAGPEAGTPDDKEAEMLRWEQEQAQRLTAPGSAPEGGTRVPLSDLSPNPDNPRTSQDIEADGLRASVAELGVIQALTVVTREAFLRHHPQHEGARLRRYVVIAGHRRLNAAWAEGRADAPVMIDDNAAENPLVWAVAENLQRVGLNPMEQARALRVLTDPPPHGQGMGQADVARAIGKSQGFVSQRISLLRLVADLQEQVLGGTLKVKRGLLLAKLPADEQAAAAAALQRLAPQLQADIDGGRLTDIREALRLTETPADSQNDNDTDSGATPRAPRQRTAHRQIRVGDPASMAADLAQALPPEELGVLVELLIEHTQGAVITE
ncbi:ParB/RepB/Spo0J family partition protein [Streptomyces goshikiensis]|uniref:ParB/RepB/Spo0J family partition protein n=1 Tax=Streptomyces goshikiensis TaxID=1942 RepID=UPI0036F7932D